MEEAVENPREPTLLERIRNTWEFANLAQWIFTFGRAVKIDENLGIEVRLAPSALGAVSPFDPVCTDMLR